MDNKDIARAFGLTASLMELHGENDFRIRSYRNAYNTLRKYERPLDQMEQKEIESLPGIGKSTAEKILELVNTGQMKRLESYRSKTPDGIQELLTIRGLGPRKVKTMWRELGIESTGDLLLACNENRLILANGFGLKTQSDIKQKIEYYLESKGKWLYARIEPVVLELIARLSSLADSGRTEMVGELARKCPIIHDIELLSSDVPFEKISGLKDVEVKMKNVEASGSVSVLKSENVLEGIFKDTVPFTLFHCGEEDFAIHKFELIGTPDFLAAMGPTLSGDTDIEIFDSAGKPYVIPEMRESAEVFDLVGDEDKYVRLEDIKGIVHNHSTYSDGLNSLREMSEYVRDSGYGYFGICDHSKTAVYANGLQVNRVMQQWDEIDALNEELAPFRIFKGIESDILSDGSLDYNDEILDGFDLVVASVHSGLKMDAKKATRRILTAVENPYTDILGHMTGRLLLMRKGYPVDHMEIIDACAEHGVAIELNAHPLRLDMDYEWIQYALEKGVWIAINPDAHSREGIHNVRFGVLAARKGGLLKASCLNALSAQEFEQWLVARKNRG